MSFANHFVRNPAMPLRSSKLWLSFTHFASMKCAHGAVTLSLPGLAAENVLKAGEFFGICGFASIDWVNCEWSCQYLGVLWISVYQCFIQ